MLIYSHFLDIRLIFFKIIPSYVFLCSDFLSEAICTRKEGDSMYLLYTLLINDITLGDRVKLRFFKNGSSENLLLKTKNTIINTSIINKKLLNINPVNPSKKINLVILHIK